MLSIKEKHLELLKQQEGYRQYAYHDTKGILTVGYGRNLESRGVSKIEASYLLTNDVEAAYFDLNRKFEWFKTLDDITQGVLVNMVVNMGIAKFSHFERMIDALESNNHEGASREMLSSLWARQVGKRANILSNIMLNNRFPDNF